MSSFYQNRPNIVDHIRRMIEHMITKHNKVLPVRMDLHFPFNYYQDGTNREAKNFERNINRHFEYHGIDMVILIAREHDDSHNPHYHVFMLVDGNKFQSAYMIFLPCEKIWAKIIIKELLKTGWDVPIIENGRLSGLVHFCDDSSGSDLPEMEMVRRPSKLADADKSAVRQEEFDSSHRAAVDHGMYLAKEYQKGNAPKGTREMLGSQIPKKKQ